MFTGYVWLWPSIVRILLGGVAMELERVFETFGVMVSGDPEIKIGFKYFGKIYVVESGGEKFESVVVDVTDIPHKIISDFDPSPIKRWLVQAALLRVTMPHYVVTVNGKDIRPGIRILKPLKPLKPFKRTVE